MLTEEKRSEEPARKIAQLTEAQCCTEAGIILLGELVQSLVEENDIASACRYQEQKYKAVRSFYGEEHLKTIRTGLYLRELKIRSSPVFERVAMCRRYWQDAKKQFGETSYEVSRLAAPLYLLCCEEAAEYEEMHLLCREIIFLFEQSEDPDDQRLVLLCKASESIYSSCEDAQTLTSLCDRAQSLLGSEDETTLILLRSLGLCLKKAGDGESVRQCISLHQACFDVAMHAFGVSHRITLLLACDLAEDLAYEGRPDDALEILDTLGDLCGMVAPAVETPNLSRVYSLIYARLGDYRRAEKYAAKALECEIRRYGAGNNDALDAKVRQTAFAFLHRPQEEQYLALSRAVAQKLDSSFLSFLVSSERDREAYFAARRNQYYFKAYTIATMAHAGKKALSKACILSLWENLCNHKTFLSDCELIHHALERNQRFSEKIGLLRLAQEQSDNTQMIALQRELLDTLREYDFASYSKQITVQELPGALAKDEILLDYYAVESIDGRAYGLIIATHENVRFVPLSETEQMNALIAEATQMMKDPSVTGTDIDTWMKDSGLKEALGLSGIEPDRYHTVFLCPDGALYQLPFDVILGTNVRCLVSAKDVIRKHTNGRSELMHGVRRVTAFGAPAFDLGNDRNNAEKRGHGLSSLPGTMLEVECIKTLYGSAADVYLKEAANVENFLHASFGEVVHIGTHANTDGDGKLFFSGFNDLLSGADLPDLYGRGFVSCADICELDFSSSKLVVLSACRTAAGEYSDYIGLRSLRRSFQLAGAQSTVAALWEVNDISTAVLMYRFYDLCRSKNPSEALTRAKMYVRTASAKTLLENEIAAIAPLLIADGQTDTYRTIRDRLLCRKADEPVFSHPYYWAGFQFFQ